MALQKDIDLIRGLSRRDFVSKEVIRVKTETVANSNTVNVVTILNKLL